MPQSWRTRRSTPKVLTTSCPQQHQSIRKADLASCVQRDLIWNKCKRDCDVKVTAISRFLQCERGTHTVTPLNSGTNRFVHSLVGWALAVLLLAVCGQLNAQTSKGTLAGE